MNSQDLINISQKAKCETEAFINRHLNDRAKGWPKNRFCRPAYTQYRQDQQAAGSGNIPILMAQ
jgi:hypothetical protein